MIDINWIVLRFFANTPNKFQTPAKSLSAEKKKPDPGEVRENIRKGLAECLTNRAKGAEKEFTLSESDIKSLAAAIEKELYNFFGKVCWIAYLTYLRRWNNT